MEVVTNFFFSIVTNIGLKQTIKKILDWDLVHDYQPSVDDYIEADLNVSLVQLTDDFK